MIVGSLSITFLNSLDGSPEMLYSEAVLGGYVGHVVCYRK